MMFSVYTLTDPRTNQVRYVGISCNVEQRYYAHLNHDPHNRTKRDWIQELKSNNLVPTLTIIEADLSLESAKERELQWIEYHLAHGMPLTNISGVTYPWVGGIRPKKAQQEPLYIEDPLLLIREVAQKLGITPDHVRRIIKDGKLPASKVGTWLVKASDVDALVERMYHKPEETK